MFVYWGAVNYGKKYIRDIFRTNRKSIVYTSIGPYYLRKWEYNDTEEIRTLWFRNINEKHITKTVDKELLEDNEYNDIIDRHIKGYVYSDINNFINDILPHTANPDKSIPKGEDANIKGFWEWNNNHVYPIFDDHPSRYDHLLDECNCDLSIAPSFLLGVPNKVQWKKTQPIYDKCISILKKSNNVIPYKENLVDSISAKLAMFDPKAMHEKIYQETGKRIRIRHVVDAHKRCKEIVWYHIDTFFKQQRNMEKALIDLNIPYEYFNMDTDNYLDFFNLKEDIKLKKYTHPTVSTEVEKENVASRWKLLNGIAEDYIKEKNFYDERYKHSDIELHALGDRVF
tara:strand:+ start:474 stop:1496 length:1023 start_codon:yes stop_codon:yes gene_type:complete